MKTLNESFLEYCDYLLSLSDDELYELLKITEADDADTYAKLEKLVMGEDDGES